MSGDVDGDARWRVLRLVEGVPAGGSVCRGAPGRVVNIAGGGGVAPLYPEDVLEEALDA